LTGDAAEPPLECSAMCPPRWLLLLALCLAACGRGSSPPTEIRVLESPAGAGASLPRLTASPEGEIWLSWVEPQQAGGHALRFSVLGDLAWQPARTVAAGDDWFVNWADFPSVVPLDASRAAAHWLVKRSGSAYAYDVVLSLSTDRGLTWGAPIIPHGDDTVTEHGFVSLFPWDGDTGAVWLDGRFTDAAAGDEPAGHHGPAGGMTLRAGRIDRATGHVAEVELDGLVCDCCQTGSAVASDGVVIVYRDRTEAEVRDISVIRHGNDGWSEPAMVASDGWRIDGCPVNGPAVDTRGNNLVVAWFTGAGEPQVRVAMSADGGRRFSAPQRVSGKSVLGRVDVTTLTDDSAVISWLETGEKGDAEILYRRIDASGALGPVRVLALTAAARSAGFPQMTRGGDGLVFAWTRVGEPSGVATVTAPIPPLTGS